MPKTNTTHKSPSGDENDKEKVSHSLTKEEFESFNPWRLGIGNVAHGGEHIQALAVFYDLESFTSFCDQRDSHLVIPNFLSQFVNWLYNSLADEFRESQTDTHITLNAPLPFFSKFLGDGVLLLWDTDDLGTDDEILSNLVKRLHNIVLKYDSDFLPGVQRHIANIPKILRCGIARGQIIPVGDGQDYVGSCINVAARLQKLGSLRFAVSQRGINLTPGWKSQIHPLVVKQVEIRGIQKKELVYVFPQELEKLSNKDRELFKDP